MAQKGPSPEEVRLAESAKLAEDWKTVRQFMLYAMGMQPITQEHEQNFLRVRTEISKIQRALSQKLPAGISLNTALMTDLLKRIYSLDDIREKPAQDRQIYLLQWHKVRLSIAEVHGALQYIAQGYKFDSSTRVKAEVNVKGGDKNKNAAGKKKKTIISIVVLIALAATAYYMMTK